MKAIAALFTRNIGLKILALILALVFWFYITNEVNKESERRDTWRSSASI